MARGISMFGTEVIRLLREKWPNSTLLAEELFAILSPNIPLTHNAPLTINNPTAGPGLIINNAGGGDTTIRFDNNGTPVGSVTISGDGITFGGDSSKTEKQKQPDRTAFVGTVTGGTGASYTVTLDTGATVGVTVPGILGSEQIPAGANAVVIKLDNGTYKMPFPLWVQ